MSEAPVHRVEVNAFTRSDGLFTVKTRCLQEGCDQCTFSVFYVRFKERDLKRLSTLSAGEILALANKRASRNDFRQRIERWLATRTSDKRHRKFTKYKLCEPMVKEGELFKPFEHEIKIEMSSSFARKRFQVNA